MMILGKQQLPVLMLYHLDYNKINFLSMVLKRVGVIIIVEKSNEISSKEVP